MRSLRLVVPLVVVAMQAGCDDLLTESPRATLTTENFYRTDADLNAAMAAAYRPLSDGQLFGTDMKSALIVASDIGRTAPNEANPTIVALERMSWDPRTPRVTNPWIGWYGMITTVNALLERLPASQASAAVKTRVEGEAKFLRALGYFYLVRLYGDVPLVTTTAEQLGQPSRTAVEEVYAQILRDAQEAEAALPLEWDNANKGRAPKGAAQTLLADVHLWRQEWQLAADAAKRVIDSGVFALEPNYLAAFLPGSQFRREEIFAAQASNVAGAPQIRTADMFFPQEMGPNVAGGWSSLYPLQWHVDSYPEGDYRHEATYFTSGHTADGALVSFAPHVRKYRPTARPGPQDVNWPIYRFAEPLLMYAEAQNELNNQAEAVHYVNLVRARARNGSGSESRAQPADLPVMGQAELREAIFDERRWELAYEADRWFDIVRRGPDYFMAAHQNNPIATDVQVTDMLWPVPQREIDVNPNLVQNPGY